MAMFEFASFDRISEKKGLALAGSLNHNINMEAIVLEARQLRPEIIQRVEGMDEESLLLLHRVLLRMERDRLWRELSAEAEADRQSGKLDRLSQVIREARAELRNG